MRFVQALIARLLLLGFIASPSPTAAFGARKPKDAVLLQEIKALTFRKDKATTHRRVSAIPQLKCTGGSARGLFEPETMRCTNTGSSYSSADVEWTCTASLPPEFKLGSTDVVCEGYNGPDDEYVLKGSCGVQYRLVLTERGEQVYGKRRSDGESRDLGVYLFWILFMGVAGFIVYNAFWRNRGHPRDRVGRAGYPGGNAGGGGGGGGGGGSGDGNDDPPPPYTPRKPYTSKSQTAAGEPGWRPGFWTGAATAYAASRMFSANRNNNPPPTQRTNGWGGFGAYNGGNGGWGPGTSTNIGRRHDVGEGSSRSSGGAPHSSTRYESSGFGSTSRR